MTGYLTIIQPLKALVKQAGSLKEIVLCVKLRDWYELDFCNTEPTIDFYFLQSRRERIGHGT